MAGLTTEGLVIRTQTELQSLLEDGVDASIPGINVRVGPVQQMIDILSEELASAWEAIQAVNASFSDAAEGLALDQLSYLTGTIRRAATKSSVTLTVNLDAGTTLPAGKQVAVDGNPDAIFETTEAVTNSGASAADVSVVAEATVTGPVSGPAGSITEIVTPYAGWNSSTNTQAADEGQDIANDTELATQRRVELAGAGTGTTAAITADVSRVIGVEEAQTLENVTLATVGSRPGKSVETIIWDGDPAAADDDEVAQAIWDAKPAGISAWGVGSTGNAIDDSGATQAVLFTRATEVNPTIVIVAVLETGAASGWADQVIDAVVARGAEYQVGESAYMSQLSAAAEAVASVKAITSLTIDGGGSVSAAYNEIIRINAADVSAGT